MRGVFPASNLPRAQLALPCSTFFEPFGYDDGGAGILAVQEYHSGAILWWFQRLSTKPLVRKFAEVFDHETPPPFRANLFSTKSIGT